MKNTETNNGERVMLFKLGQVLKTRSGHDAVCVRVLKDGSGYKFRLQHNLSTYNYDELGLFCGQKYNPDYKLHLVIPSSSEQNQESKKIDWNKPTRCSNGSEITLIGRDDREAHKNYPFIVAIGNENTKCCNEYGVIDNVHDGISIENYDPKEVGLKAMLNEAVDIVERDYAHIKWNNPKKDRYELTIRANKNRFYFHPISKCENRNGPLQLIAIMAMAANLLSDAHGYDKNMILDGLKDK